MTKKTGKRARAGSVARRIRAVPKLTLEQVAEAMWGPRCSACARERTLLPSRMCLPCLGPRACPRCRGRGAVDRPGEAPSGCGPCGGTGLRARRIVR